ncbi:alpha-1,3/alpha-1,6-mannosyltransferase [Exophiala viscosa]|uniref:Alpha-1,3/1,6-mannosyltransferase ALG2 n=1 Tax=Exophiala viscosa TaxID=2486360 RepID=A0AAN6DXY4_9EURO|nr:alpha-1,3/alpha-1,6-mannosyltransferase [Exophiala viscosa]KAI1624405.1 alpha-1,3/alpha-1,6-mannosyltransferase [Exophiala viscosa]
MSTITPSNPSSKRSIVFFHPDLGIGGAERLIIDAAVGLQEQGNKVTIFTSHCDPKHCFDEARDGTLDVRVRGNTLFPPTFLNRFHILLAILRQIHLVLAVSIWTNELNKLKPDVFLVDQLPACVPLLRWLYPGRQRTLFYCHFPDQLLADRQTSGVPGLAKKLYRFPFDWFEGWSMSASDKIVVNSTFTKSVASRVWPDLAESLGVIYPCVNVEEKEKEIDEGRLWEGQYRILLSINRFERKKNIGLAIRAYQNLSPDERRGTRLLLAGGYDQRVSENVHYHQELDELAQSLGLSTATAKTVPTALAIPSSIQVLFLLSVPGPFKNTLLQNAQLLLYTPSNEHFGIVPVEAMLHGLPVLASNTGGPLETIVEGKTGWLRDVDNVDEWAAIMKKVLHELSSAALQTLSRNGRQRVNEHFTRNKMADGLENEIDQMVRNKRSKFLERKDIVLALWLALAVLAALFATLIKAKFGRGDARATEFARVRRANAGSEENLVRLFPGAA